MNVTVVTGHLSRPPERRTLPSGEELVSYDLSVVGPDQRAESVPVAWPAAPVAAADLEVGEALLVVGRVRRRFFRAGGATQSRTEVVANTVVPLRRKAAVRRLLTAAAAELDEGALVPPRRLPIRSGQRAQAVETSLLVVASPAPGDAKHAVATGGTEGADLTPPRTARRSGT